MSTRYNTGNPIESTDVRDMSDNAKNFDEFSNSMSDSFTDRFGVDRQTMEGAVRKAGFRPASFDFLTGGSLVSGDRNKAVFNPAPPGDNNWYAWQGAFPKIISPNSTPSTSGGLGDNAWKPVTNNILAPTVMESIRRSYAEAGYNVVGTFQAGFTIVNANDVGIDETTGKGYTGPAGTVAAGTNPATSGGVSDTGWKLIDGVALRRDLTSNNGANIVQYVFKGLSTSTKRTIQTKLDERVSLLDFHCDSSQNFVTPGVAVDSRPYIQAAIDCLAAAGGGTLVIPEINGAWYLNSYGTGAIAGHSGILQLKSNVNICLEGQLQLSATFFAAKPYQVFVGFDNAAPASSGPLNNVHIYGGGTIDFGSSIMATGGSGSLRNGVTFGCSFNCSIRNITFQNGDVTWGATIGWNGYGSNTVIEQCNFVNLILSANNPDHSTIYVNAPYCGVDDCYFASTNARARIIACTVELHQHNTWYTNSRFTGYTRGCYVVMHSTEIGGAGSYLFNAKVIGNSGDITGQFVIFSSENISGTQGRVSDVVVANNVVNVPDGFTGPSFANVTTWEGNNSVDVSRVLIVGNSFTTPAATINAAALTCAGSLKGMTFRSNYFNVRNAIFVEPAAAGVATLSNFDWDETNVIGPFHNGQRSGINLFEMRFASIINSSIAARLSSEDTSMFSVQYYPATCAISHSKIRVAADFTANMTNTVVFENDQQTGANVYAEYPVTVNITSYANQGAVAYFSTGTAFAWVTSARPLTSGGTADYQLPAAWTSKSNGQLIGLGFNEVGASRSGSVRLMLSRKL